MIELPYGLADFRRIRQQGMVYVDRTAHLRDVERLGSVLVFLRPRRFGKSLWLETSFSLDDLTTWMRDDQDAVASLLYYMGLLTLTDVPGLLRIPNLVVRKLFLDRLLEIFLPATTHASGARRVALRFAQTGELAPLLAFFEQKLLPVLSNRDQGSGGVNERTLEALLLAILFDDTRYVTFSELELKRRQGLFDLLFELKLVRRAELGKTGEQLRALPAVPAALAEARSQVAAYRDALSERFGAETLRLRCYVIVAVGFERLLGEETLTAER